MKSRSVITFKICSLMWLFLVAFLAVVGTMTTIEWFTYLMLVATTVLFFLAAVGAVREGPEVVKTWIPFILTAGAVMFVFTLFGSIAERYAWCRNDDSAAEQTCMQIDRRRAP